MEKIKLAIIGYGAMSELYHVPAAMKSDYVDLVGVYDLNIDRLKKVGYKYSIPYYGSDYSKDIDKFNAAIVAVPNNYHSKISIHLIKKGKHVLVEKPMALSHYEAQQMYDVSKEKNVVLTVGHVRKLYPNSIFIKNLITSSALGKVTEIKINEGNIFSWPMASRSFLDKKVSGGGILIDMGIHVLDLLAWWLKDLELIEYLDDSINYMESDCEIKLVSRNDAQISVCLSRQRAMSNTIRIIFEKGILMVGTGFNSQISLDIDRKMEGIILGTIITKNQFKTFEEIIRGQIDNFYFSIINNDKNKEAIISAMKAVELVEACYKKKKDIIYGWEMI